MVFPHIDPCSQLDFWWNYAFGQKYIISCVAILSSSWRMCWWPDSTTWNIYTTLSLQVADALIVLGTFALEVVFTVEQEELPLLEAATFIVILRLWRVPSTCNSKYIRHISILLISLFRRLNPPISLSIAVQIFTKKYFTQSMSCITLKKDLCGDCNCLMDKLIDFT